MNPTMFLIRPGDAPTHDTPEGGQRWHYLSQNGERLDPPAFIYRHIDGGWGGECKHYIFPDGYSPAGPATREHIQERIEALLEEDGWMVVERDEQ